MSGAASVLIIACGALAHELIALIRANGWSNFTVQCLPADLHNYPDKIPDAVRAKIQKSREKFDQVFVAYGDCGTGGMLDTVLQEENVERLPGAHCYEFFAGSPEFAELAEEELGTFYLTDFLARHFQRIVIHGFGLDRHPEIQEMMFGNYKRVVYLSQTKDKKLMDMAKQAADRLNLSFEHRHVGYGDMAPTLGKVYEKAIEWRS